MKKKKDKFVKIFSFVFVLIFIFLSISFSALAASEQTHDVIVPNLIERSTVMDDLKAFGIDITKYQKNIESTHCQLLYFLEYGYDERGPSSDYGLYLYVYNPSGRTLNVSGLHGVGMQLRTINNDVSYDWTKLDLEVCSVSGDQGYENVFLKLKVKYTENFYKFLSKGKRIYELSGIELHFLGNRNPTEFGISSVFSFIGFMAYYNEARTKVSTLQSYVSDILTVDLKINPVSWKTKTSDKGVGYQYEMFSVYFSVPNDIIDRYGDENNRTKGLIKVKGSYYEYKINGIVTNSDDIYDMIYPDLGKQNHDNIDWGFVSEGELSNVMGASWVRFNSFCLNSPSYVAGGGSSKIPYLCSVFSYEQSKFSGLSVDDFKEQLYSLRDGKAYYLPKLDDDTLPGHDVYFVESEDDLSDKIGTFASTTNAFVSWFRGLSDLYDDTERYSSIKAIDVVEPTSVSVLTDKEISKKYYMQESEAEDFRKFVISEAGKKRTSFIMRFAVRDYYCDEAYVVVPGLEKNRNFGDGDFYFEKTIFNNFDILSLTWKDSFSRVVEIPVIASPVDNFGTVTPPIDSPGAPDDPNETPSPDGIDWQFVFRIILIVVLFVVLLFVLNKLGILKPIIKFISKLFSKVWKGIKFLFGWFFGLFKKRDKKKQQEKKDIKEGGEEG